MPQYIQEWEWQEAFHKFGFHDGDEWVGTYLVAQYLEELGYDVDYEGWGMHNTTIIKLAKDGKSLLPHYDAEGNYIEGNSETEKIKYGYDEPETYLPADLVKKLNEHFDDEYIINI